MTKAQISAGARSAEQAPVVQSPTFNHALAPTGDLATRQQTQSPVDGLAGPNAGRDRADQSPA